MSFSPNHQGSNKVLNNPDSFAIAFDEAWKQLNSTKQFEEGSTQEEKISFVFAKIKDHPFLISSPQRAAEIAKFRLRLLKL